MSKIALQMYTFSNKLKIGSLILMALGLLGMGIGFVSAPATVAEAKAMVADAHGDGHGGGHEETAAPAEHGNAAHADESHDVDNPEHSLYEQQTT